MDRKTANKLRQEYPNHVPLKVAAAFFGVSPRQLSWLIAERREPFASIGANIGTRQKYIRIYTEPLIRYLSCEGTDALNLENVVQGGDRLVRGCHKPCRAARKRLLEKSCFHAARTFLQKECVIYAE